MSEDQTPEETTESDVLDAPYDEGADDITQDDE